MDWTRDITLAARQLARAPAFALSVTATLGIGIGFTTAVMTVVNAVLLRPLPFANAERIVRLTDEPSSIGAGVTGGVVSTLEPEEFVDLEARVRSLAHLGIYVGATATLSGRGGVMPLNVTRMSAAFFPMLGETPVLGRGFDQAEESDAVPAVVVLSHATWMRWFGGARDALGQTVLLDGQPATVIGVMRSSFAFPDALTDAWTPFHPKPLLGRSQRFAVYAALQPDVPLAAAAAEVSGVLQELRGFPSVDEYRQAGELLPFTLVRWKDELVQPVRPALYLLAAAAALVLLAACVNVTALFLARGTTRAREVATRLAIGASRVCVLRMLLVENLVLAALGGTLGALVATGGLRLFVAWGKALIRRDLGPGVSVPRLDEIGVDPAMLTLAAALAVASTLLAGLWPAVRLSGVARGPAHAEWLRGRAAPGGTARVSKLGPVIVVQVALATALLVASTAVAQGFVSLVRTDLGFDPKRLLTFRLTFPADRYQQESLEAFSHQVVDQLKGVPGVQGAAYASHLPLVQGRGGSRVTTVRPSPGHPPEDQDGPTSRQTSNLWVHHDLFRTLGLRVLQGRALTSADDSQHSRVVVVNEALARSGLFATTAIGQLLYFGGAPESWEVVGVVQDFARFGIGQLPTPEVYFDTRQLPALPGMPGRGPYVLIKTDGAPLELLPSVRAALARVDGDASMMDIATMDQIVDHALSRPRLYTGVMLTFAGTALAIAASGIFAVVAYGVAQRRREVGIRLALGATPWNVVNEFVRQASAQWGLGLVLGLGAAMGLVRYVEAWLVGMRPEGVVAYVVAGLAVATMATLAVVLPARRAATVSPADTLRAE